MLILYSDEIMTVVMFSGLMKHFVLERWSNKSVCDTSKETYYHPRHVFVGLKADKVYWNKIGEISADLKNMKTRLLLACHNESMERLATRSLDRKSR